MTQALVRVVAVAVLSLACTPSDLSTPPQQELLERPSSPPSAAAPSEPGPSELPPVAIQQFPGDPKVDAILRETIGRWRFKPTVVDGSAVMVCTQKR